MQTTERAGNLSVGLRRASASFLIHSQSISLYAQVIGLIAVTFVLGRAGVAPVRYGFIAGCVGIAAQAWRLGPSRHLEMSIILFAAAPFLRRVVDYSAGFEPSGYLLVGPTLGLLPPCIDLYNWLVHDKGQADERLFLPFGVLGACLLYAATLSVADGQIIQMGVGLTKFAVPALYGMWLAARGGEEPNVMEGAARGFMAIMPLAGAYGIYQYFYAPDWDSYWMLNTAAYNDSQGLPEAEKIRVFSILNSAASFAHFCAAGLLLLGFVSRTRLALLLCLPVAAGLMLSLYRTAWMGLAASLAYCWMYMATRRRAEVAVVWSALAIVILLSSTSFGDVIIDRFSTFSAPSQDGSGQVRAGEYADLYDHSDKLWVGLGLSGQSTPATGAVPQPQIVEASDGTVVETVLLMGLIVGSLYLIAVLWASAQALIRVNQKPEIGRVVAGAIVIAHLLAFPLANITRGEIGFLFWSFLGIATSRMQLPNSPE
jgi:hypothetical protein